MNEEEYTKKYGKEAYEKKREQSRNWDRTHPEELKECLRLWRLNHPEKVKESQNEQCRKGGKYYEQHYKYSMNGLPHERKMVRTKHANYYHPLKKIIAPDSQIHHEWIPSTADYRGIALVEKDQHLHGFIDVIHILEGGITILTEKEIRGNKK